MPAEVHYREQFKRISTWLEKPFVVPLLLLFIGFLCYGLMINRLGYYWDDFPITYIRNVFGFSGLERYFSTNRPIWGVLYQITFRLFSQPLQWQVVALILRWLSAYLVWLVIRNVWPSHKFAALSVCLLFLVYPGFKQQHISVIYSNLFFILDCFLFSLYLNIKAIQIWFIENKRWMVWFLSALSILFCLLNLLTLEYFYALELLRPLLIWFSLNQYLTNNSKRIKITLLFWSPFLISWLMITVWRFFFFSYQTNNYKLLFFRSLRESPVQAVIKLLHDVGISLWVVIVSAWTQIFKIPDINLLGLRATVVSITITLVSLVIIIGVLFAYRESLINKKTYLAILFLGLLACMLGGIPWWLTELLPSLVFPNDRFTLTFMLGVCMVIVGLLGILPIPSWIRILTIATLVAFAIGSQFMVVYQFRRDWALQTRFFWQLAWRMPEIKPGTTIMVNELPVTYYSDNSLTAPLNWIWAPSNNSQQLAYLLLYPSQRMGGSLTSLNPGTPISEDYLVANFRGNTSQTVAIYYQPPGCIRVLDHYLDTNNPLLPSIMKSAATLSSSEWIQTNITTTQILPDDLFSPEPEHQWCYYFEKADIARQDEKWDQVAALGDKAYQLSGFPEDPSENFVFIEGYAHVNNWEKAKELTEHSVNSEPMIKDVLCQLWDRIDSTTVESQEKEAVIGPVFENLGCK